jgi:hypothetical protein
MALSAPVEVVRVGWHGRQFALHDYVADGASVWIAVGLHAGPGRSRYELLCELIDTFRSALHTLVEYLGIYESSSAVIWYRATATTSAKDQVACRSSTIKGSWHVRVSPRALSQRF